MKKFLIISFVCSLFSCQNTCKEIIENSKTETEAVAVGQIPENIITKKSQTPMRLLIFGYDDEKRILLIMILRKIYEVLKS
jgi:lipoprotein